MKQASSSHHYITLSIHLRPITEPWQIAVAVEGWRFVFGHLIIRKVCRPLPSHVFTGVVLQIEFCVLGAAAARKVYMLDGSCGERQVFDGIAEDITPQRLVQLAVAQMICLAEKDAQPRQPFDHLS